MQWLFYHRRNANIKLEGDISTLSEYDDVENYSELGEKQTKIDKKLEGFIFPLGVAF